MENGEKVKRNGLSYRQTIVVATISAILSGSALPWLLSAAGVNPYRPQAFTAPMGEALEKRIKELEEDAKRHRQFHPDQTGRFDARLEALEAQNKLIIAQLDRLTTLMQR